MNKKHIYMCSLKDENNYIIRVNLYKENNILTFNNIITNLENEVIESVLMGFRLSNIQKEKWLKLIDYIKMDFNKFRLNSFEKEVPFTSIQY